MDVTLVAAVVLGTVLFVALARAYHRMSGDYHTCEKAKCRRCRSGR